MGTFGLSSLDKKPFDLRDRDLLHVKRDLVKTLEIAGPQGSYALAKTDKGEWAFTNPLATLAGRWTVDGLLGTVEGLRMESVAAEEAKDFKKFGPQEQGDILQTRRPRVRPQRLFTVIPLFHL